MRRKIAVILLLLATLAMLVTAAAASGRGGKGHHHGKSPFPATIALPNGFQPEGIDLRGTTFYVGSIPTGDVYRGSILDGQGSILVDAAAGRSATGLEADRRGRLFVSGGGTGRAFVYDANSGAEIASYVLTNAPSFINDVVVTKSAVWFADSFNQVLYKLALGKHGALPASAQSVPLTGDIKYTMGFNANGIDATKNGKTLVIVQSNTGLLFTVDPATGLTHTIDLGGALVQNGDGILLRGKRLYVVENFDNLISVVRLKDHLQRGEIVDQITDPRFQIPTTIDRFGSWLYAVNARFNIMPTPDTTYSVVRVSPK